MRSTLFKIMRRAVAVLLIVAVSLLGLRIYQTERGPPLEPWHTFVPDELSRDEIDKTDWAGYLEAEDAVFEAVRAEVTQKLPPRTSASRSTATSRAARSTRRSFEQDWNRSYVLEPDGPPKGAVVLLHGLTDSPYSLRHIARLYRDHGFVAIGDPRCPRTARCRRP